MQDGLAVQVFTCADFNAPIMVFLDGAGRVRRGLGWVGRTFLMTAGLFCFWEGLCDFIFVAALATRVA